MTAHAIGYDEQIVISTQAEAVLIVRPLHANMCSTNSREVHHYPSFELLSSSLALSCRPGILSATSTCIIPQIQCHGQELFGTPYAEPP